MFVGFTGRLGTRGNLRCRSNVGGRLRSIVRRGRRGYRRIVLDLTARLDLPGEVAARQVRGRRLHVINPHVNRPVAAVELIQAAHVVKGNRVTILVRLIHGHARHHAGYEADELGGQLIRGSTGLAGRRQARDRAINVVSGTLAARDGLESRHNGRDLLNVKHARGFDVTGI